jgi:hypothetical protein
MLIDHHKALEPEWKGLEIHKAGVLKIAPFELLTQHKNLVKQHGSFEKERRHLMRMVVSFRSH